MIPVNQTKNSADKERGNCLAACLASIFELKIDQIPQFEEMELGTWRSALQLWARANGRDILRVDPVQAPHDDFYVIVGLAPSGLRHACVGKAGEIVHDPHHLRGGLTSLEYLYLFPHLP